MAARMNNMACLFRRFSHHRRFYSTVHDIFTKNLDDEILTLNGWVTLVRRMKERTFINITDGSTHEQLQVVIPKEVRKEAIRIGASVAISGKVARGPSGQEEMVADTVAVLGDCVIENGYPFVPKKQYAPEYVRDFLHFRPRISEFAAMLRIRAAATEFTRDYFRAHQFVHVHAPTLTANDCEGAGETFHVRADDELTTEMRKPELGDDEAYFDRRVFLTVSSQLHLESCARALSKVYHIGSTFRAENTKSRFHLAEFTMIEAEIAFTHSLRDILVLTESFIKTVTNNLLNSMGDEIAFYWKKMSVKEESEIRVNKILNSPYTVMEYDEASRILDANADKFTSPFSGQRHLTREHELFLVKQNDGVPLFVVNWPRQKKPFYMKSISPSTVAAVDLLFPEIGELCGGGLREDDPNVLEIKLKEEDMLKNMKWYLDLRRFGNVPTGGFGLGFERYLKVILGTPSIKDTVPFPRWPHNCRL